MLTVTDFHSLVTQYLTKRYGSVGLNSLPWQPSLVVLEGMFMIQTLSLAGMEKLGDYAAMFFNAWIKKHLQASDVHVIFDHPGGLQELP